MNNTRLKVRLGQTNIHVLRKIIRTIEVCQCKPQLIVKVVKPLPGTRGINFD